jgi:hypothetical protein
VRWGGPDVSHAALLATVDALISAAGGFLAGIGTAAFSNLARAKAQDAPFKAGYHDPVKRQAAMEKAEARGHQILSHLIELRALRDKLAMFKPLDEEKAEQDRLMTKIEQTIGQAHGMYLRNQEKIKSFTSEFRVQTATMKRTMAIAFEGKTDKSPDGWLGAASFRQRWILRGLANTVSLLPAAFYLAAQAAQLAQTIPLGGGFESQGINATDPMSGNQTMPSLQPDIDQALPWTMNYGTVLILGFTTRVIMDLGGQTSAGVFRGVVRNLHERASRLLGNAEERPESGDDAEGRAETGRDTVELTNVVIEESVDTEDSKGKTVLK